MARIWVLFALCFILQTATSADEVDKKADDMAKAIAQQNKKVEEESEALEKAIDEKGKQVDTKEQEDKFEKASEKMDAVGNAADKKFEQNANLVDKIGEDANNAIENQANKVEALNSRADKAEDKTSKLVDKIGKKIEKDSEPVKTKPRMSIAYTFQLPREPHADPMTEKASDYDSEIKVSNKEAENSYPWPARQDLHEDVPDFNEDPDETKSDMSLKPFDESDADVDLDAHASSKERFAPRGKLKKMFSMPHAPIRHRQRQHLKRYRPPFEKASLTFVRPTPKSSDLGLLVLPSGGPRQLPDDIKNQMEEDRLLRKTAKQTFNNGEEPTNHAIVSIPTKRTGDKIEPSKVVVFPDSAVKGTDTTNMQIKEFHPKNSNGKWLAVHIPDRLPYPRQNMRIIASKNAANDLQKVVGPTQDTLAMEIQSILGIDGDTLDRKIAEGESDDETNKGDDDDNDDADDDDDDDNGDEENDVIGDPLNDKCDDSNSIGTKHRDAKKCKRIGKNKPGKKIMDGSGIGDEMIETDEDEKPKVHVEQPEGFELRWEDILNNFKNFNLKRKKKICKLFALQNDMCQRVTRRRKHSFKKKLKHYLLQMLRKFLRNNKNDFEDYLSNRLKDALAGQLKPSDDGLLHIYDKNSGHMNMEDFLKDLNDGTPPQLGGAAEGTGSPLSESTGNPLSLTMDDNTVNGGVFRLTPQMNSDKLTTQENPDPSPPDAVSALNNIIHPLLNDQDNKLDEKLQTKILQEELNHVNSEQEEQERQKIKDASLNDRLMYMFKLQNLATHKPEATAPNGEIAGQPISVVSPHQVSLLQMDLPDKNPDIPLLASSSPKEPGTRSKARTKLRSLPLRRRVPFRRRLPFRPRMSLYDIPRLLGSIRLKNRNGNWHPTMRRFWKRSYARDKKRREREKSQILAADDTE